MAMKGDLIMGYNTLPVSFGEKNTKLIVLLMQLMTISIPFFLYMIKGVSMIMLYFLFSAFLIVISMVLMLFSQSNQTYSRVNTVYKFVLLAGIISIVLF